MATVGSQKDAATWLGRAQKQLALIEATATQDEDEQDSRRYLRMNLAVLQTMLGDDAGAKKSIEVLADPLKRAIVLSEMAMEQWVLGKDAMAHVNFKQSIRVVRTVEFLDNQGSCWNMIGFAAGYAGQTKYAVKWIKAVGHPALRSMASIGIAEGLFQRRADEIMKTRLKLEAGK